MRVPTQRDTGQADELGESREGALGFGLWRDVQLFDDLERPK